MNDAPLLNPIEAGLLSVLDGRTRRIVEIPLEIIQQLRMGISFPMAAKNSLFVQTPLIEHDLIAVATEQERPQTFLRNLVNTLQASSAIRLMKESGASDNNAEYYADIITEFLDIGMARMIDRLSSFNHR